MLVVDIATYLIPGILLFVFLPSGFFVYFEGWSFEESVYFAYVTLTTIGYGDYVAGTLFGYSLSLSCIPISFLWNHCTYHFTYFRPTDEKRYLVFSVQNRPICLDHVRISVPSHDPRLYI